MAIAVLIKQTPDMNAVRIDAATGKIAPGVQLRISSYDEYAIEAALRLRERCGGEVIAVTAGPGSARDAITRALAMGADRGIHLELDDVNATDTLGLAKLLADAVRPLRCDVVLAGQTADDLETGQVGAEVAALLELPVISNVVEIELDGGEVVVRRDMEDGYQTVRAALPVIILASTGLPEPRLPTLKGIMGARKKPIDTVTASVAHEGRITWEAPYMPQKTTTGTMLQDVPSAEAARQLVDWLMERKLI